MANEKNLIAIKKGEIKNPNGRPKGSKGKKQRFKILLDDIISIHNCNFSEVTKKLMYNIYEIVVSDMAINQATQTINHLYFIESEYGVKIGISKDVETRFQQIKSYCKNAKVIKVISYAGNFEKLLHKKFKHLNIKDNKQIGTEWFLKNDELNSFIEKINKAKDLAEIFGKFTKHQLSLFD